MQTRLDLFGEDNAEVGALRKDLGSVYEKLGRDEDAAAQRDLLADGPG